LNALGYISDLSTKGKSMKGKTVVITGATSGLGRTTAFKLAQKGAFVVIVARNDTKAKEVIKGIEMEGGKGQFIISDLSSMEDTKAAAESITKVVDRLDVLINNAGAFFPKYRVTSEGFESTLALNYLSPFLLTHHLAELMKLTARLSRLYSVRDSIMSIIVNLDVVLAKRKMKLTDLANAVGITLANLSILKTGKVKAIRFSTLEFLCEHLQCQPADILEYVSDE
jgi:putative transcriptional regulator